MSGHTEGALDELAHPLAAHQSEAVRQEGERADEKVERAGDDAQPDQDGGDQLCPLALRQLIPRNHLVCKGRRITTLAEAAARASARPWARRSSLARLCRAVRLPEPPVPALRGGGGALRRSRDGASHMPRRLVILEVDIVPVAAWAAPKGGGVGDLVRRPSSAAASPWPPRAEGAPPLGPMGASPNGWASGAVGGRWGGCELGRGPVGLVGIS